MIQKLEGKIASFKAITKWSVQFELQGVNRIIELTVSEPWVVNRGDTVLVAGEEDSISGKFIAYAYRNKTKNVFGMYDASGYFGYWFGTVFIVGALLFAWAIFPLFIHLPMGIKCIKYTTAAKNFHQTVINAAQSI